LVGCEADLRTLAVIEAKHVEDSGAPTFFSAPFAAFLYDLSG
jgi:hypothetical protein